jgi:uncharacterized membrane protein
MTLQETASAPQGATSQTAAPNGALQKPNGLSSGGKDFDLDSAAKALGWFSIGLGAAEFLFPRSVARIIGTPPKPLTMRVMGLREIGVGVGILAAERKAGWIKARVAGDAIDLAMLKSSFDSRRANRVRLATATAGVAAVTATDMLYARKFADQESGAQRIHVEASMAVNKPAADCYEFWRQVGNFPKFMKNVEAVETNGERTRWRIRVGPTTFEWDAEMTEDVPSGIISWRSVNGAELPNSGSVRFEPRLGNSGSNIRLTMEYDPPAGGLGGAANPLLETISQHHVRENLRRFKSLMESGEVPETHGQSSGPRTWARQSCGTQKGAIR